MSLSPGRDTFELFPEINRFKGLLNNRDRVEPPMPTTNLFSEHYVEDDLDEPEANTPDGLIPNSWLDEEGLRHAVVWSEGEDSRMRVMHIGDDWALISEPPF